MQFSTQSLNKSTKNINNSKFQKTPKNQEVICELAQIEFVSRLISIHFQYFDSYTIKVII